MPYSTPTQFEVNLEKSADTGILRDVKAIENQVTFNDIMRNAWEIQPDGTVQPLVLWDKHLKIISVEQNGVTSYLLVKLDQNNSEEKLAYVQSFGALKTYIESYASTVLGDGSLQFEFKQITLAEEEGARKIFILERRQEYAELSDEIGEELEEDIEVMITRLEGIRKDYKASAINLSKDKSWFKRLFNTNDNSTELEKNFYDIFDQKIRIDIDNIDQTLIDLKDMKKQVNKGTNMRVHAKNYQDIQIQTEYFDNQARRLADMLVGQDQYSNFSQTGFNLIDLTIRSSQDAKNMKEVFDKIVDEKQKINLLLHSVALDKIKSEQQESLQDYLNHVLEEDTVANDKFVPWPQYAEEVNNLLVIMPELNKYINKVSVKSQEEYKSQQEEFINTANYDNLIIHAPDYKDLEWEDAFTKGGVKGVLSKAFSYTNMTQKQREFSSNAIILGSMAFLAFKAIKALISKDKDGKFQFWKKLAVVGGVWIGSQALSGEGPLSLIYKTFTGGISLDAFKKGIDKVVSLWSEDMKKVATYPNDVETVLGDKKISELPDILTSDFTLQDAHKEFILEHGSAEAKEALERGNIKKWLEQAGIMPDTITELDQDKTVGYYIDLYQNNVLKANDYLATKGLKISDNKQDEFWAKTHCSNVLTNEQLDKMVEDNILTKKLETKDK